MEIVRGIDALEVQASVVTMGAFDGVHLGHKAVIERLKIQGSRLNAPTILISFEPHPQFILRQHTDLKLLTTLEEKEALVQQMGIDYFVVLKFTPKLQHLSYKEFIMDFLHEKLHAKAIVVGYDHHFGHNKSGNRETLENLSRGLGIAAEVVSEAKIGSQDVKSSLIRKFLHQGHLAEANRFLGYDYMIGGVVVKASGRGLNLGFPTANLEVDARKLVPARGVYVGKARLGVEGREMKDEGRGTREEGPARNASRSDAGERATRELGAVVNIGCRPTFDGERQHIECFLLDFNERIYGEKLEISLMKRLRDEIKFKNAEALKMQISHDIASAKHLLMI